MEGAALMKFLAKHKMALGAAAGGVGLVGAGMAAKPYAEKIAADMAVNHFKDEAKKSAMDTADFAEKHPYVTAAALAGGSGAGAGAGNALLAYLDSQEPHQRRR